LLPVAAVQAQSADHPPRARRAHTLEAPRHGRVLGGVERGANAAGRGINRADAATRRGIGNVSEKASRPVRKVGEAFGRKLARGSSGRAGPPPVGPQGNAP
jgi:hypothetical protein